MIFPAIDAKYSIGEEYLIIDLMDGTTEKVELQKIDGISAFVEYIERPMLHSKRYGEVTVFRLKPVPDEYISGTHLQIPTKPVEPSKMEKFLFWIRSQLQKVTK